MKVGTHQTAHYCVACDGGVDPARAVDQEGRPVPLHLTIILGIYPGVGAVIFFQQDQNSRENVIKEKICYQVGSVRFTTRIVAILQHIDVSGKIEKCTGNSQPGDV